MGRKVTLIIFACVIEALLIFAFIKYLWIPNRAKNEDATKTEQTTITTFDNLQEAETEATTETHFEGTQPEDTTEPEPTQTDHHTPSVPNASQEENEGNTESNTEPTTPVTDSKPNQDENQPAWKKLYANYATINKNSYEFFALIYIDGDDIPELYLFNSSESQICAVRNNQVISQKLTGVGGGNYHKESGHFLNVYQDNSILYMRVYHLASAFSQVFFGREIKTTDSATYYIGDSSEPISEEAFKEAVSEYIDTTKTSFMHENALTYDALIEQLR